MNNTNNNSISSIKVAQFNKKIFGNSTNSNSGSNTNTKGNLLNQKMTSFNKKTPFQFIINDKIQIYNKKNKNDSQVHFNNAGLPIDILTKTNSQYIKYKFLKPNSSSKANASSTNKQHKNINTNNYMIHTLNLSEKNFIHNSGNKQKKYSQNLDAINYENEINKYTKEKEELSKIYIKQERLIQKLSEDNNALSDKINILEKENHKINKKISVYQENQEQLIMLVKIIQQNGVNVEYLIDKWNSSVEKEEEENTSNLKMSEEKDNDNIINNENDSKSIIDSMNDLNGKIDCSSFIPITVEKPQIKKNVFKGIPKLNFDLIKNNGSKKNKEKYRNKSK